MGFFSYRCSKTGRSIPAYPHAGLPEPLSCVVLVLPDDSIVWGTYDGYGHIKSLHDGPIDIFDKLAPFVTGDPTSTGDSLTMDQRRQADSMVRFVWQGAANRDKYADLQPAPRDETQGFFYSADQRAQMVKDLIEYVHQFMK